MTSLSKAILSRDRPAATVLYGEATGTNTVTIAGSTVAVTLPALTAVVAGDYVAVLASGADRIILGPVGKGWCCIGSGDKDSRTPTVPSGVSKVRIHWSGYSDDAGDVGLRVNGEATSGHHVRSWSRLAPDMTVAASADGTAGTAWFIGRWGGGLIRSWGTVEMFCMDPVVPMHCTSWSQGIPTGTRRFEGMGVLADERTVTSLSITSSTALMEFEWRAEALFL